MKNATLIKDTRFIPQAGTGFSLQMKYRIEQHGSVLGWARYVNHGRDRWLLFNESGEVVRRSPKLKGLYQ